MQGCRALYAQHSIFEKWKWEIAVLYRDFWFGPLPDMVQLGRLPLTRMLETNISTARCHWDILSCVFAEGYVH